MPVMPEFLSENDQVVYTTGLHWIRLVIALLLPAIIIIIGIKVDYYIVQYAWYLPQKLGFTLWGFYFNPLHPPVISLSVLLAIVIFGPNLVLYFTTRIYLTDTHIFKKSGFLSQDILEIDMEEVKGDAVHKGVLGHILGYGDVTLDCRFIGDVTFTGVRRPNFFINRVNLVRKKLLEPCPENDGDKHNKERRSNIL